MWRLPGKLNVVSPALRAQPGSHATRLLGTPPGHSSPANMLLDGHVAVPRPKRRVDLAAPLR